MTEISLEQAKEIAERLEKANAQSAMLLERAEKLRVTEILGGQSSANIPMPEISDAEKIRTGAKEYFKGTVIEGML